MLLLGVSYKLECTLNAYPDCLFLHGLSTIQVRSPGPICTHVTPLPYVNAVQ